ncbi:hypothetical protein D9V86_11830 [Bacteroidetes/Chlorobi group bacterium ChocPot_Mid]|jgi:flagellar motor switch protein FliG|nr:MAG: hypothetical protein D9V86_11830 [Bacteroidetes/Chlorobi group bacterium ChocPot_Mid]
MSNFYEILDETSNLSLDEQESFVDILQKRIAEEKRKSLISAVKESQKEYETGDKKTSSVDEIMKEILS